MVALGFRNGSSHESDLPTHQRKKRKGMLNDLLAALRKEQPKDPLSEEQVGIHGCEVFLGFGATDVSVTFFFDETWLANKMTGARAIPLQVTVYPPELSRFERDLKEF